MTILESIRSNRENKEKANFVNLVAVALADGHISHEEYDELYMVGKKFGADPDEVDQIIAAYQELHFDSPETERDKKLHFIRLIRMMWADGIMDQNEIKMVHSFGVRLGYSAEAINSYIKTISELVLEGALDEEILLSL